MLASNVSFCFGNRFFVKLSLEDCTLEEFLRFLKINLRKSCLSILLGLFPFQAITLRVLTVIDAVGSLPRFTDRIEPLPAAIQTMSILYKATLIRSKRDMILPLGIFCF